MKVTIIGPNLQDQSKGTFHVHAGRLRRHRPAQVQGGYRGRRDRARARRRLEA